MQIAPHKKRIGVLRGGPSPLYDVSIQTGKNILANMPEQFIPVDIFVSKNGVWHEGGFEKSPARVLQSVDAVVNALHGKYGEDGTVQKILDDLRVSYTGSRSLPSAVSMNKVLTKKIFEKNGIKTPLYHSVLQDEFEADAPNIIDTIFRTLTFPLVVKPAKGGSSLGLTLARTKFDIEKAIKNALEYSDSVLIEEYIAGKEATCGVIEDFRNELHYVMLPVEIVLPQKDLVGVYDHMGKFGEQPFAHVIPGNFTDFEKREIERISRIAHAALGLSHYSRADFRVHPKRGVYCLEVNSLPDLSERSTFVKGLEAVGSNIKEFISHTLNKILRR